MNVPFSHGGASLPGTGVMWSFSWLVEEHFRVLRFFFGFFSRRVNVESCVGMLGRLLAGADVCHETAEKPSLIT